LQPELRCVLAREVIQNVDTNHTRNLTPRIRDMADLSRGQWQYNCWEIKGGFACGPAAAWD
jgi:hypothetical protein